jgi:hypothetical protein
MKTNAQNQRDFKARRSLEGYSRRECWIYLGTPSNGNDERVKKYVDRLNKAALKGAGQ